VQEEPDRTAETFFAQHLRHEAELVVVNPNEVAGARILRDRICVHLVDRDIRLPVFSAEGRTLSQVVEEWPQHVIGEPLIEPLKVLVRNEDWRCTVLRELTRHFLLVRATHLCPGPPKPHKLALLSHRGQRCDQTTSARRDVPSLLVLGHRYREASRGDNQSSGHCGSFRTTRVRFQAAEPPTST